MENNPINQDSSENKPRIISDFWLGFFGCLVGNIILVALISVPVEFPGRDTIVHWDWLPWLLNLAAIAIALIKWRPRIILGYLACLAAGFILSILFLMVVCFT